VLVMVLDPEGREPLRPDIDDVLAVDRGGERNMGTLLKQK
jgi:hypothetical protein